MKLLLSSQHLGNDPLLFADLCGDSKVAVIMNAADLTGSYQEYTDTVLTYLKDIGLDAYEFDLRKYFVNKSALNNDLANYGAVWVVGGNSFVLLRAMHQSGFVEVVKERVEDGTLVYGGFSAGAVVATPTLEGIELLDVPGKVPVNYSQEIIWEGLNLYDHSIVPHYVPDQPESEMAVAYFKKHVMPYKALRDGEIIVVDN
jgi:dipeptidase E